MLSSASGLASDNFLRIENNVLVTIPPGFSRMVREKLFVSRELVAALGMSTYE